jgi:hypothetical protein
LQSLKIETLDDNVGEPSQTTSRQCSANGNQAIAPSLRVLEALNHLLFSEYAALHSRLVGSDTLNHLALVFFAEALSPHRRIGHPPANEYAPEDGDNAICNEQCLPILDDLVTADEGEAIGKKTADDLLRALCALVLMKHSNYLGRPYVHHVPVGNPGCLFLALEPHAGQNNERWLASRLKNSEEDSANQDGSKVC